MTYRFKGAANREIDALAFGGSATVGFMDSDEKGWWGLYAGPGYRHLDLSPNNPGSKRGNIYSARVQLEGERLLTDDFKLNGLAGADIANNTGYWTRLRAMHRVEGDIFAGPEGMWLGDQNYHAYQVGMAIVGMHLTDKAQIGINGGYRKGEDQGGAGYGGLELGARF
ncbi:MAG: cellulose biosynthesis protein BcsS [Proteobacteria bacterium]|nr:cellulose biosynthesis protein BcsS [Pseudomonadota bacterium]